MKPKIQYGDQEWDTYCEIGGIEHDSVCIHYDTSPAEPDVGWQGGLDVQSVIILGNPQCQIENMTKDEVEQLDLRVNEYENDRTDPNNDPRY